VFPLTRSTSRFRFFGAGTPVTPPSGFSVLDSGGTAYSVGLTVLDSGGTSYTVLTSVLASDGTSFNPT
jgi:hypothetical protein